LAQYRCEWSPGRSPLRLGFQWCDLDITVTASDGALSAQDTFKLTIYNPNTTPIGFADTAVGVPGVDNWINVLFNDTEADGTPFDFNAPTIFIDGWYYNGVLLPSALTPEGYIRWTGSVAGLGDFFGFDSGAAYFHPTNGGTMAIDGFSYKIVGDPDFIPIRFNFTNPPTITEVANLNPAVYEDFLLSASGQLSISDPDLNENSFVNAIVAGLYGSLAIDANGAWTYTLDNANAAVQELNTNESLVDHVTIQSYDGNSRVIDVTINGQDEAAGNYPFDYNAIVDSSRLLFNGTDVIQAVNLPDTSLKGLANVLSVDIVDGKYQFNLAHDGVTFGAGAMINVAPTSAGYNLTFDLNNGVSRTAVLLSDGSDGYSGHESYANTLAVFDLRSDPHLIYGLSGNDSIAGDITTWSTNSNNEHGIYYFASDVIVGGDGTSTITGDVYFYDSSLMGYSSTTSSVINVSINYGSDTLYGSAYGTVMGDVGIFIGTDFYVKHLFGGDTIYAPYLGGTAIGDVNNLNLTGNPAGLVGTSEVSIATSGGNIIHGSAFNDTLIGNFQGYTQDRHENGYARTKNIASDIIYGNGGEDTIVGDVQYLNLGDTSYQRDSLGNDTRISLGSDTLYGGSGNDFIIGDVQNYTALYSSSTAVKINFGADVIEGGAGDDILN
jgi:VCBS repeat-containing protein